MFYVFAEQDYNQVADDMRSDDETMSELHQKVDDLRERLWNICDERKASAETERQDIINDGWLDDRLGIVSNQYITQMQVEAKANMHSYVSNEYPFPVLVDGVEYTSGRRNSLRNYFK